MRQEETLGDEVSIARDSENGRTKRGQNRSETQRERERERERDTDRSRNVQRINSIPVQIVTKLRSVPRRSTSPVLRWDRLEAETNEQRTTSIGARVSRAVSLTLSGCM
jgi:hypothetical protein